MVALIAPSILSADFMNLQKEIAAVEKAGADWIHLDIMDGHYVPNITIGPDIVRQIRSVTNMTLDVHLMISSPERYVDHFAQAGSDIITIHAEAPIHLHRVIQSIKNMGKKAGVSLNPATPLDALDYVLDDIDLVLIMSVNPGFGGQAFIPQVKNKIMSLRKIIEKRGGSVQIEVDGGIKLDNAGEIIQAGADVIVMGSGFFSMSDYSEAVRRFRETVGS